MGEKGCDSMDILVAFDYYSNTKYYFKIKKLID